MLSLCGDDVLLLGFVKSGNSLKKGIDDRNYLHRILSIDHYHHYYILKKNIVGYYLSLLKNTQDWI